MKKENIEKLKTDIINFHWFMKIGEAYELTYSFDKKYFIKYFKDKTDLNLSKDVMMDCVKFVENEIRKEKIKSLE